MTTMILTFRLLQSLNTIFLDCRSQPNNWRLILPTRRRRRNNRMCPRSSMSSTSSMNKSRIQWSSSTEWTLVEVRKIDWGESNWFTIIKHWVVWFKGITNLKMYFFFPPFVNEKKFLYLFFPFFLIYFFRFVLTNK